jgi:hypothetical protein
VSPSLVIGLYPVTPTDPATFTTYLTGLSITAYQVDFNNPATVAAPPHIDIGSAAYTTGNTEIFQLAARAAGAAVIDLPGTIDPKFLTPQTLVNVVLRVTRGGVTLFDNDLNYDVLVDSTVTSAGPVGLLGTLANITVGLYLSLPDPGLPAGYLGVPPAGGTPTYAQLTSAVTAILAEDPAAPVNTAQLTAQDSLHIAREIVANRTVNPLPQPLVSTGPNAHQPDLGALYTSPPLATVTSSDSDRRGFEGALASFYSQVSTDATAMAGYVYAWSAAQQCEQWSSAATTGAMTFPLLPPPTVDISQVPEATLILNTPAGDFTVSAEFFYALGAQLPTPTSGSGSLSASDRYSMVGGQPEPQLAARLELALESGLLATGLPLTPLQAARRLSALGGVRGLTQIPPAPNYPLGAGDPAAPLVTGWLNAPDPLGWTTLPYPDGPYWETQLALAGTAPAHLRLIACALTGFNDPPLSQFVTAIGHPLGNPPGSNGLNVTTATQLANVTASEWREFLTANPQFIPAFTQPQGTVVDPSDRIAAFTQYLSRFYTVMPGNPVIQQPTPTDLPLLDRYAFDPLASFLIEYWNINGVTFQFGVTPPGNAAALTAVAGVFPGDDEAQQWLRQALDILNDLAHVTAGLAGGLNAAALQFSVMEALFARGFTSKASIAALDESDFAYALTGSVAFQWANQIWTDSGGTLTPPVITPTPFHPVNGGGLRDCVPPPELSPLGPVEYLYELLQAGPSSTCAKPKATAASFGALLQSRRGDIAGLAVDRANLQTPLPVVDLVNECLEYLVAHVAASGGSVTGVGGIVRDTAAQQVRDHHLRPPGTPPQPGDPYQHDPAALFGALPEHSSPASPVAEPAAYTALAGDYSAPDLPYAQPLDVSRSHLAALGVTRAEAMRRFRAQITEFVLGPDPAGFDSTVWRYPLRSDIAPEYLQIAFDEYEQLFATPVATTFPTPAGQLGVWQLYSFPSPPAASWVNIVLRVSEFLHRTGLSYCEFVELANCGFMPMKIAGRPPRPFDECEPCHLDQLRITFGPGIIPVDALMQLAVFIRLWRLLQRTRCSRRTFAELSDICDVLGLFAGGVINRDFIPQLVAFELLREELCLPLAPGPAPAGATGVARTPLLALWATPASGAQWDWALGQLLERLPEYARALHGDHEHEPRLRMVLAGDLDPLSQLAGFDPATPTDTWHYTPTRTLRFVEILAKLYASPFTAGSVQFLFTAAAHLPGEDPFPLQTDDEAREDPLGLPAGDRNGSLWDLRHELLEAEADEEEAEGWSWRRIESALREEFGYDPGGGPDPLRSLAEHCFPDVLERAGQAVTLADRHYTEPLATGSTTPGMWNTDPHSPVSYPAAGLLQATLPLSDEAVLELLARVRQLKTAEAIALRNLYWKPRLDLAALAFLFNDPREADRLLIQEHDEERRWRYFRHSFVLARKRCRIIARHLARHAGAHRDDGEPDDERAWLVLKRLYADGDPATTPWEAAQPSGAPPAVTWPIPAAGAFAALLGLCGTGLTVRYSPPGQPSLWSEQSGPLQEFGDVRDHRNTPLPTLIPAIQPPPGAPSTYVDLVNGFALSQRGDRDLGGAEGFSVTLSGVLLVEHEGRYRFAAGAPTAQGEPPRPEREEQREWGVTLRRGASSWVLLSHRVPGQADTAPEAEQHLRRGAYEIVVEYRRPEPQFDDPDELVRRYAGLQVKYAGPDTGDDLVTIPRQRLYIGHYDPPRIDADRVGQAAANTLAATYVSSLSDIRRTYQRAFKAVLLAARFDLSARPAEDGQTELGFMLAHPDRFAGTSFHRAGGVFTQHRAQFDFNFLPVLDSYPAVAGDDRAAPSRPRQAAMFDWWERLLDYTELRRQNATDRDGRHRRRLWRLFTAAEDANPTDVLQLMPHLEIPLDHNDLVQRYVGLPALLGEPELTAQNLVDERWPIRAWKAERFLSAVLAGAYTTRIASARPDWWAADDPSAGTPSGNDNLTQYVGDALLEMGEPRRYRDLRQIDDGLRERARRALVAYLCRLDRVQLPGGPPKAYARGPENLSDLLLLDVSAGLSERASRIDDAVTAVQTFVERALLHLEPGVHLGRSFRDMWAERFATFRIWQACKRRELYPEDTVECEELERARRHQAFRLLEEELRDTSLSIPVPAGIQHWDGRPPAPHASLTVLQAAEPATLHLPLAPGAAVADAAVPTENFGLLGRPDRAGSPAWLSPLHTTPQPTAQQPSAPGPQAPRAARTAARQKAAAVARPDPDRHGRLPYWIEAAVDLGARFLRVAAAGEPAGSALPKPAEPEAQCCCQCGTVHPPRIDEYYFWLAKADYYDTPATQQADLTNASGASQWEDPATFPALLDWEPEPMVHLHWCRIHNGEFGQLRRSGEGVALAAPPVKPAPPTLELEGRVADSLVFTVDGGIVPAFEGGGAFPWVPPYTGWTADTGWRYDLADDDATLLPLVVTPTAPTLQPTGVSGPPGQFGGLSAYPFFVYGTPGESLIPLSRYAPVTAIAGALRCHCQFEDAVGWYERYDDPFNADNRWGASPPTASRARHRSVLLDVLETLLCWGDAVMAARSDCGPPVGDSPEAASRARVIYAAARRLLGPTPVTVLVEPPAGPSATVGSFTPLPPPLNPRLMTLYLRTDDRLGLIREWDNRRRRRRGQLGESTSFWGGDPAQWGHDDECGCGACEHCGECGCCEAGRCEPGSPYRFDYLQPKALELADELRTLGAELLAAYEKGDAEFLESLRSTQQHQLQQLTLAVHKDQWRDADWQVQALKQARLSAQNQVAYYTALVQNGLIGNERLYQDLTGAAEGLQVGAQVLELVAQIGSAVPDTYVGEDNFIRLPFPVSGTPITDALTAAAKALDYLAQDAQTGAGLALTESGWDRRLAEWRHQIDIFTYEVERLTREILGAERRADGALRELTNQQRTIEQAAEVDDFLRGKFTNHALYLFLQRRTAALHREAYELALTAARQAERAFNLERGRTDERFIEGELWNNLHHGLLAGERLGLDLRRMERAYRDCNRREYEMTKNISLQRDFPLAFLALKLTGRCELQLPEWMFDVDYPGQYMRRIKTVALTIPCVTGPYTGVHCRLTLLSSTTRTQPWLNGGVVRCCCKDEDRCGCCDGDEHREREAERYRPLPGDPRIVRSFTAADAIATSTGTNDSGLFEVSLHDERYLPFEFAGAVSHWRVELPPENNQFDFDTLTDVIMRVSYTAREGGTRLRAAATAAACCRLPGDGLRLFDVRHEFPDSWPALRLRDRWRDDQPHDHGDGPRDHREEERSHYRGDWYERRLRLGFGQRMFPFVSGRRVRWIDRLVLVFAAPDAEPGRHHLVRFWRDNEEADGVVDTECIATGALAGCFVGVVDLERPLGPLGEDRARCTFAFGDAVGEICSAYVIARYQAECWPRCGPPGADRCCRPSAPDRRQDHDR